MKQMFTKSGSTVGTLVLIIVSAAWPGAEGQASHDVDVSNYEFNPAEITIQAGDEVIWTNSEGSHNVNGSQSLFPSNPESFGNEVGTGWVYSHAFTMPGTYDYQCDPHASLGMTGRVIVEDTAQNTLTVHFSAMNPHVGQTLWLAAIDNQTGEELSRTSTVVEESFSLEVSGLETGKSYNVDFFADFNENGYYDAPPADHAWRLELESATGDDTLEFVHNTDFTDVDWKHRLRVLFSDMTPHVGQMLALYVRDMESGSYLDTVVIDEIMSADFNVASYVIKPGGSYLVDFYADFNQNGMYDAPPADHAWRLETGETMGDVDLDFIHNTDFTDIFGTTGTGSGTLANTLILYPNPAGDQLNVTSGTLVEAVTIFSVTGAPVKTVSDINSASYLLSLEGIGSGVYFVEVTTSGNEKMVSRLVIR